MIVSVEEAKVYLRVDFDDEDQLIESLVKGAIDIVASVSRMDIEVIKESKDSVIKTAVLYVTAYLYEHREEADHSELMLSLRNLLMGVRKAGF